MKAGDGSPHAWLAGQAPLDLIVTLDDATSAIYSIFLVEEEGTASSFRGLDEVISRHGLFSSLYTDRGSHYFTTPKAGGTVDKQQPTAFPRDREKSHQPTGTSRTPIGGSDADSRPRLS